MNFLKHESNSSSSQKCLIDFAQLGDRFTFEQNIAFIGLIEPPQQMQQSAFAATGWSDNGDEFSLAYINTYIGQGQMRYGTGLVRLGDVYGSQ